MRWSSINSIIHHLYLYLYIKLFLESILSRLRNPSQYSIPLAHTERFTRSYVLYVPRSFPTDISEDVCDDFIDS